MARAPRQTNAVILSALLSGLLLPMASAATAQEPAIKELLGKAQTQSQTKAVEDLIGKLQSRTKTQKAAEPVAPEGATTTKEPVTKDAGAQTKEPPPPTPSPPTVTAPEVTPPKEPEAPVKGAEAEPMPSVDLEIQFEYKSAQIYPAAVATLTTLGRALTDARLAQDYFLIAGHTDTKGGAEYNLRLSQQRAEAVRAFLIENFGIDGKRLVARGFGQRRLKDAANPLSPENRRVQIINFTPPKR